jgi:hypothetical protein
MQLLQGRRRNGHIGRRRVDTLQGDAIALDFLLGAVPGPRVAKDQGPQSLGPDGHAFNAVRRFDTLHERCLAQGIEYLGRLLRIEVLPALGLGDVA